MQKIVDKPIGWWAIITIRQEREDLQYGSIDNGKMV